MPTTRIVSRAQLGLHAPAVHVEVDVGSGLPNFLLVGLPATAVRESKDRVRAAIVNSGLEFPAGRITVNLAPADVPKQGGRFDLPIALGLLHASGQIKFPAGDESALNQLEFYGELALNGELKPTSGLLLAAAQAAQVGHRVIVPNANVAEASVAAHRAVLGAKHLLDVRAHLEGVSSLGVATDTPRAGAYPLDTDVDLRDVRGQLHAKRALLIAASGGHSLLMVGPPGSGKSMLASRLPTLLPPLDDTEAIEVAMVASASAAGFDSRSFGRRPFRSPHHTVSMHALVGGGPQARAGEISLAHRGVLFLDELPEFERRTLEALREPMETGMVAVSRVAMQAEYPAEFLLVVAMNSCPCGYHGDPDGRCTCSLGRVAQYRARVSGPLLDRIDLRVRVSTPSAHELMHHAPAGESSADARVRVAAARSLQLRRANKLNARMSMRELMQHCRLDAESERLFWESHTHLGMSARAYHHMLRVARTIADLEKTERIRAPHVAEALQLRRALDEQT